MEVLLIAFVGLAVGFILILLIGRTSPPVQGDGGRPPEPGREHAWISTLGLEGFGRLLATLFGELKFEIEKSDLRDGAVDLFAVNPTPITGGRIYVRGVYQPPLGMVGEEEVRMAIDAARAEMAGKAIVATPGGFTPEARAVAQGNPVDLVDGPDLQRLVKKHLPQVAAARHF